MRGALGARQRESCDSGGYRMPTLPNDNRPTSEILDDDRTLSAIQCLPPLIRPIRPSPAEQIQVGVHPAIDLNPHPADGPSDGDSFYIISYLEDKVQKHKFTVLFDLIVLNKPAPLALLAISVLDETAKPLLYIPCEFVDLGRKKTDVSRDGLNISIGDQSDTFGHLSGDMDQLKVEGHADASGALDILLNMTAKGPTFNYLGMGMIPFPGGKKNYEYALPCMKTGGTLKVNGIPYNVTGTSWLDREWGDFAPAKWTWMSIKLENGVQIGIWDQQPYVANSNAHVGGQAFATMLDPNGGVSMTAVTIQEYGPGTSPGGKHKYADSWSITVPGRSQLTVRVLTDGQEINSNGPIPRLEARCSIEGEYDGADVTGAQAFVEVGTFAPA